MSMTLLTDSQLKHPLSPMPPPAASAASSAALAPSAEPHASAAARCAGARGATRGRPPGAVGTPAGFTCPPGPGGN